MENASYLKSLMKKARGQEPNQIAIAVEDKQEAKQQEFDIATNNKKAESSKSINKENKMKVSVMETPQGADDLDSKKYNSKKSRKASDTNISKLFNELKDKTIEGEKKRLIRFEDKSENVLKLLQIFYSVDVTVLVNYIVNDYFLQHPELIAEIKRSIKSIDL